jgi:NADH:ubiquinone oxidoreductase subunit 6 (subunit J)
MSLSETPTAGTHRPRVLAWYAAAAVLFFLIPFVGTEWLGLQPDLYYLGYFTVALTFFVAFVSRNAALLKDLWTLHWWQSILVGAVAGAALAIGIFQQASTPHAEGWRFGFEIAWRGIVYGTVDALTLYIFPAAVAYLLLRGDRRTAARKVGFAGLALVLSMFVTATYHLGYTEFRDQTLRYPEIGAVVANIPTALTGNPVGAVVAHTTMHVASVVQQRDGGNQHMLPPRATGEYPNHGSSDLAAGLAVGWMAAAAAALTLLMRRQRGY